MNMNVHAKSNQSSVIPHFPLWHHNPSATELHCSADQLLCVLCLRDDDFESCLSAVLVCSSIQSGKDRPIECNIASGGILPSQWVRFCDSCIPRYGRMGMPKRRVFGNDRKGTSIVVGSQFWA
jgi:hypothetical protein